MTEKFEIKIVRLRTGEDLIGFYHQDKETNTVILKYCNIKIPQNVLPYY